MTLLVVKTATVVVAKYVFMLVPAMLTALNQPLLLPQLRKVTAPMIMIVPAVGKLAIPTPVLVFIRFVVPMPTVLLHVRILVQSFMGVVEIPGQEMLIVIIVMLFALHRHLHQHRLQLQLLSVAVLLILVLAQ